MLKKTGYLFLSLQVIMLIFVTNIYAKSEMNYLYNKNGQLLETKNTNGNFKLKYDQNGNLLNKFKTTNLLMNSGFEEYSGSGNVADGWEKYMSSGVKGSYELIDAVASEGKQFQRFKIDSLPSAGDAANIWQGFFIQNSQTYSIKGKLKLTDMKNAKLEVIVFFYDANNQMVGGQTPVSYSHDTSDWVTFAGNVTSPANATTARVHLHLSSTTNNGRGTVNVDGVSATLQSNSNLLFNSGFEWGQRNDGVADGWEKYMSSGVKGSYELIDAVASEGKQFQRFKIDSLLSAGDAANIWQGFFIQNSQTYSIKGKLKLTDMKNAKLEVIVFFYDANNQMVGGQTPVSYSHDTSDWVTFAGNVTSPANATTARVHLHLSSTTNNGRGTVNVDGVSATLQSNSNLLFNSGFEWGQRNDGVADGWEKYMSSGVKGSYELINVGASEGKQSQRFKIDSLLNAGDAANIWQGFFIQNSQTYSIKGKLKLTDMKNAKLEVIVFFYDANNQMVGGQTPAQYVQNTSGWVTFAGNVTSPANATTARVHMHLSSTASFGQGTVYVDEISIIGF